VIGFWVFFFVYSTVWGALLWISFATGTLLWHDLAMSVFFGVLLIAFLLQGTSLIGLLDRRYSQDQDGQVPGKSYLITMVILLCSQLFLRMIFVSIQDIAKVSKITSIE